MTELDHMRDKLCRELAQSELDAMIHTIREANRLGTGAPAEMLRAISAHACALQPLVKSVIGPRQPVGLQLGRIVGRLFSGFRQVFSDRILAAERSYRATLLGLRHGVDLAVLLREVAMRLGDRALLQLTDKIVTERRPMVDRAVDALGWFAQRPVIALVTAQ
jgi:hypothetical protein